jgi:hypothetical protein
MKRRRIREKSDKNNEQRKEDFSRSKQEGNTRGGSLYEYYELCRR